MVKEVLLSHQNVKKVRDFLCRKLGFNETNRNDFIKHINSDVSIANFKAKDL